MSPDSLPFVPPLGSVPGTFAVDDVQASTEILPTAELLPVAREKVGREVLLSPLAGHRVVTPSTSCCHALVEAVHLAFSRHLPLTLSPDAIWLTLAQGFSHHINENAAVLRSRLVRHSGRTALAERIQNLTLEQVQGAVAGFSRQIRAATDPVLHDTLVCDFTTTTPDVRTASEVALMDTYSQYFEFSWMMCICGIPHITLSGSVEDWRRIRKRLEVIETFGLGWWVERLRPILDEFVRAAEGRPDREFWRGIYKFRPAQRPYESEMATGWLVDLFPYLGDAPDRRRSHVFDPGASRQVATSEFPSGLCSVEVQLKLEDDDGQVVSVQELELVAGLLGVEQAREDRALSPSLSWCLARRPPAGNNMKPPFTQKT